MLHIAVVEDDREDSRQIQNYIYRYGRETEIEFQVHAFEDGSEILNSYQPRYDIILLDIELPQVNGMDAAAAIRRQDSEVVLMFITNMAQYAINGYEVGALDFVLKPVNFYTFSIRFARAVDRAKRRESGQVLLTLPDSVRRISTHQIYYVEVQNRMLHYHTDQGEMVVRGTMQAAEQELSRYHFVRCNYWYLVNLRHVTEIRRDTVLVAGQELEISRRNRNTFMTALTNYVGGTHG